MTETKDVVAPAAEVDPVWKKAADEFADAVHRLTIELNPSVPTPDAAAMAELYAMIPEAQKGYEEDLAESVRLGEANDPIGRHIALAVEMAHALFPRDDEASAMQRSIVFAHSEAALEKFVVPSLEAVKRLN